MNTHLENFLQHYAKINQPGYAVLVTGEWGAGKTYRVKNAISEEQQFYVSIYGLQSAEEISASVFAVMYPEKSKARTFLKSMQSASIGIPGFASIGIGNIPSAFATAYYRNKVDNSKVLILDDFERCEAPIKSRLATINQYVEHFGCRVVVIANTNQLGADRDAFDESKEKSFGQIINVKPNADSVFPKYMDDFCEQDRVFLEKHRELILKTYQLSGSQSLRVLGQSLRNLVRLSHCLPEKFLEMTNDITLLIPFFMAFDIAARQGILHEKDVLSRISDMWASAASKVSASGDSPKENKFIDYNKRFSGIVDLGLSIIEDNTLIDLIYNGFFDCEAIKSCLLNAGLFVENQKIPAWKRFMSIDISPEKETDDCVRELMIQFDQRQLVAAGELLHMFSLRMLFSSIGIIEGDHQHILRGCKAYIDDLRRDGRLPPRNLDWRWPGDMLRGFGGYGFWVEEAYRKEFMELGNYLIAAQEDTLVSMLPSVAYEILELMKSDIDLFRKKLTYIGGDKETYAVIPVLSHVLPVDFVSLWIDLPPENACEVESTLIERYAGSRLLNELKDEIQWISRVQKLVQLEACKSSALRKLRLGRLVDGRLGRTINDANLHHG